MSADANPALQQLGRRLSEARQACGFSLEEHADRLHMGREQLQALEAGNREGLPEPVFVIAQARRVATSLGIEIDEEIAALRSSDGFQTPQANRPAPQPPEPAVPPAAGQPALRRPAALPITLLALVSLLVAAATLLALRGLPRRNANPPASDAVEAVPESATVSPPAGSSVSPGPDQGPGPAHLVLEPSEPSWVEVRSADGTTLFRGSLEREQRFPLAAGVEVLAGRPDLVQVRLGTAPATVMGAIEDVRWRSFSADRAPGP